MQPAVITAWLHSIPQSIDTERSLLLSFSSLRRQPTAIIHCDEKKDRAGDRISNLVASIHDDDDLQPPHLKRRRIALGEISPASHNRLMPRLPSPHDDVDFELDNGVLAQGHHAMSSPVSSTLRFY